MKGKWIALVAGSVVVAGAGVYAYQTVWDRIPADVAISITPMDAGAFASVYVNPSNDQKRAIDSLLKKFPQTESFDDTRNMLVDLLDPQLEPLGIDFEDDIEPWLGDQIGIFLLPPRAGQEEPDAAALFATEDQGATQETIDKVFESQPNESELEERIYEGVEYTVDARPVEQPAAHGFVENYLVVGSEAGLKASIDASQGESLEDSENYQDAIAPFYEDRLALFYIDGGALIDAVRESAGDVLDPETASNFDALESQGLNSPAALAIRAAEGGAMIESSSLLEGDGFIPNITRAFEGEGLVRDLPGSSWAAFGIPQVGRLSETVIQIIEDTGGGAAVDDAQTNVEAATGLQLTEDFLSWMGDAALFVQGSDLQTLGGGVVVDSSDPAKTDAALDAIADYVNALEPGTLEPVERDGRSGYTSQPFGIPVPINILGGENLIIAVGEKATDDLLSGESTLGESERFAEVDELLGSDLDPVFFVDIEAATELATNFIPADSPEGQVFDVAIEPILKHFTYVVLGVKVDGDTALQRFVVGIE